MPFGLFGERMPYTNFHRLNLDWLIRQVKELGHDVSEYKEQLDAMGVSIEEFREYIDNIDLDIQEEVAEQFPAALEHEIETGGFNRVLAETHKRRIVFIGDSYGVGWTPIGTFPNWIDKVAGVLGLIAGDYVNSSIGSAGFSVQSTDPPRYVPTLLQNAYNNINNPETVTDVVFGMGYNDHNADNETIRTGIVTAINKSKQLFPNARNHIFGIGFTTNVSNQKKLASTYWAYETAVKDYDFHNISDSIAETTDFVTDGIHPNENGQNHIAMNVVRILNGGSRYNYIGNVNPANMYFDILVGDAQTVNGLAFYAKKDNFDFSFGNVGSTKVINLGNTTWTITGNAKTKIAKLATTPFTGFYYPHTYVWTTATLCYTTTENADWSFVPCAITLASDSNDSDVYLYIFVTASSGGGYMTIRNINKFALMGISLDVPFVTKT